MKMNTTNKYIAVIYLSAMAVFTGCKDQKPAEEVHKGYCISTELKKISNWPRQR